MLTIWPTFMVIGQNFNITMYISNFIKPVFQWNVFQTTPIRPNISQDCVDTIIIPSLASLCT